MSEQQRIAELELHTDPLVLMLAPALGLDDAGLDVLFTTAAGL